MASAEPAAKVAVSERFLSIQGESTWAGSPCLFVRLAGCNLRCRWCDTAYSWQEQGKVQAVSELAAWALAHPCPLVELTGGEPLVQDGVFALMEALLRGGKNSGKNSGKTVLLESNGSRSIERVPIAVHVILDVKCPGSGMAGSFLPENRDFLACRAEAGGRDEVKFVLADEADFFWAVDFIRKQGLDRLRRVDGEALPLLFSAVRPAFSPTRLAELLLAHQVPGRLQLALHPLLWPERNRGV